MNTPLLSLCIPTFQRFSFLENNLQLYIDNPHIDEIVICDEDGSDIIKIQEHFPNQPKLKLYKNEQILGTFLNKNKVVSYATHEWICLVDSDNFVPIEYFQAWIEYIQLNEIHTKHIYLPIQSIPQTNHPGFDFTPFQNIIWTRENAVSEYNKNKNLVLTLLNTGNYIFNKFNYLESNQFHIDLQNDCKVVDVLFKNLLLFKNNSKFFIVPKMTYHHIVHPKSNYMLNAKKHRKYSDKIKQLFEQLT